MVLLLYSRDNPMRCVRLRNEMESQESGQSVSCIGQHGCIRTRGSLVLSYLAYALGATEDSRTLK